MKAQLDYIFFFYGLGFVLLAAVCLALGRTRKYDLPWMWLAVFGLIHGVNEWLDLLALDLIDSDAFRAVRVCVMAVSFVCLVEFGRIGTGSAGGRLVGRWATVLLLAVGCSGCLWGWPGLNAACRYSLGFTGAIWSSLAFFAACRRAESPKDKNSLTFLGVLFVAYAIASGMIVPSVPPLFGVWLNQDSFMQSFGLPVQLLRGVIALAAAAVAWVALQSHRTRVRPLHMALSTTSILTILASGWFFTQNAGLAERRDRLGDLMSGCRLSAAAIDPAMVSGLGYSSDAGNPRFDLLRKRLISVRNRVSHARFVYVTVEKAGKIVFAADAESTQSKDYSPPGSSYHDAPKELSELFRGKALSSSAEYTDRWGNWVSAFAVVRDPTTGRAIATLGMDVSQDKFKRAIALARIQPIAITLLALLLVIAFYVAYERQMESLETLLVSQSSLAIERERLATTLGSIGDGVIAVDTDRRVTLMNHIAEALTGWSAESAVGLPFANVFCAMDEFTRKAIPCPVEAVLQTGEAVELSDHAVLISRSGEERNVADSCAPIRDADGALSGVVLVFRDQTERIRAAAKIQLSAAAMNAAGDLIVVLDDAGKIVFANNAFQRQSGYALEELRGEDFETLLAEGEGRAMLVEALQSAAEGTAWSGELLCKSSECLSYTADIVLTPFSNERGQTTHFVAIARNVTERKVYEGMLDYQAHHDALTDLPNRVLFSDELETTILARIGKRKQCAVLFVDLDRFKLVNDTMGHHAGDCLLVEVASRLASCLREGDVLARMGGDEFTALLRNVKSAQDAGSVATRMLQRISAPFEIKGTKLVIGASIGISIYPDNATDVEGLLKSADSAMYRAKELGRNNRQFYSEEQNEINQARIEMERDLRLAMKRNEMKVCYQPIVDAQTMRLAGAEALLRWDHPEKGTISPGLFVPIAEETGIIAGIGMNVLETACRQAKRWNDQGYGDIDMSVNVSAVQLRSSTFATEVFDVLSRTGLPPTCLNLEITETMLSKNDHNETQTLDRLMAAGVKICLDDFGIGYSSLSRLKEFPIIHMKVDGSFIRDIGRSPKDRQMTESIISLAHSLGIRVTAEWIENEEQMATIRELDCDYAQGYLISPALSPEAFESFAAKWRRRNPGGATAPASRAASGPRDKKAA